jgi:tetratricopeptide (TPR) repeat protein
MNLRLGAVALVALLVCATRPALADDRAAAQQAYAEGKRLYDVGDYSAALAAFKRAYLSFEEPTFLFNMAQCQRQLGHAREAIQNYRSFLRNQPNAPNREEVERLISKLEAGLEAEPQAPTAPAPATNAPASVATEPNAAPQSDHRRNNKKWIIAGVVGGVVIAGLAVGLGVGLTVGRHDETSLSPVTFP